MIFDPKTYINPNEPVIVSGNCYTFANGPLIKFALTGRKLIQAGENLLIIIPLNKITCITNTSFSTVVFSQQGQMTFYHGGHPEWYAALEQQLGLRLG